MKKYLSFIFVLVLLDQITKYLLQGKNISLLPYISFHYAENTGVAFSLFQGYNLIFILFSLVALGFVMYYFKHYPLALSFFAGGIIGNLLDRIIFGFVRDFISIGIWPIFNLADSWNSIGLAFLCYAWYQEEKLNKALNHRKK